MVALVTENDTFPVTCMVPHDECPLRERTIFLVTCMVSCDE